MHRFMSYPQFKLSLRTLTHTSIKEIRCNAGSFVDYIFNLIISYDKEIQRRIIVVENSKIIACIS